MSLRILIIGGSGFIGTNAMEFYLTAGAMCLNLDIVQPANAKLLPFWRELNVLDLDSLKKEILDFRPSHMLYLAAETRLLNGSELENYAVNYLGVENVIQILKSVSFIKRVVFASSMLVCKAGYQPADYDDYCPPNKYGHSKVLMEKKIKEADISNFEWLIVRPTSIWGPWFHEPYRSFFERILNNRYLKIRGKTSTKSFGFIYNAIYQIDKLLFMQAHLVDKRTFYIADSPPLNINVWADLIAAQVGKKLYSVPYPFMKVASAAGDVLKKACIPFPLTSFRLKNMTTDNVISLLKDTTDLMPEIPYSVEEGIAYTIDWIRSQS